MIGEAGGRVMAYNLSEPRVKRRARWNCGCAEVKLAGARDPCYNALQTCDRGQRADAHCVEQRLIEVGRGS